MSQPSHNCVDDVQEDDTCEVCGNAPYSNPMECPKCLEDNRWLDALAGPPTRGMNGYGPGPGSAQ